MKKTILLFLLLGLAAACTFAQKAVAIRGEVVKDGAVYFSYNGRNLEYFTSNMLPDSRKPAGESVTFSLKGGNSSNLYFKWLNPLRYRYSWKDTTYADERERSLVAFVNLLLGQFGVSLPDLDQTKLDALAAAEKTLVSSRNAATPAIEIPIFNNTDLTLLFFQLSLKQNLLSKDEIDQINQLGKSLKLLDEAVTNDVSQQATDIFAQLYAIENPDQVLVVTAEQQKKQEAFEAGFLVVSGLQKELAKTIQDFSVENSLLKNYIKISLINFLEQTTAKLNLNKAISARLVQVFEIMKNSVRPEDESISYKGYYRIRHISFGDGQTEQTSLVLSEYEFYKTDRDFIKKADLAKVSLIFQTYDRFALSFSAGLFYSNTTLKGYGVAPNDNGQFIVVEDDITKNSPVSAVFLNINFSINSRYFAPLAQLGVDPTKRRPFILAGGGFSIPAARLAISGGPIWTWNPTLDKLQVGQPVASTTQVEDDVTYKFEIKPKGWYLGVQYNF